jgi:integrase
MVPAEQLGDQTRRFLEASKTDATRKAYRSDWAVFTAWCEAQGVDSLPAAPETVAFFIADEAGRVKAATITRRLATISQAHQAEGHEPSPTSSALVRTTMAGIRRTKGTAQTAKAPALTADIRAMVDTVPGNLLGVRDRALLLIGFAGAFRRSELVALDVSDVVEVADGLVVTLRHSKTDQDGAGRKVGIPYGSTLATCPVRSLKAWLEASAITEGPLFRNVNRHGQVAAVGLSDKTVALVVKRAAERGGLDPALYAGHSLRAGLATSAAAAGVSERAIMAQTGHKSLPMVRRYIRDGQLFRENAAAALGL